MRTQFDLNEYPAFQGEDRLRIHQADRLTLGSICDQLQAYCVRTVKYNVRYARQTNLLLLRSWRGTFKAALFSFSPVDLFP